MDQRGGGTWGFAGNARPIRRRQKKRGEDRKRAILEELRPTRADRDWNGGGAWRSKRAVLKNWKFAPAGSYKRSDPTGE